MSIDRRDFLAKAATASLLGAVPLDAALASGTRQPQPTLDGTDLSWVDRLKGKSRAVFDSPAVSEGLALFRAATWRTQLNTVFGTPLDEVTPVVVIRHEAIPLIMDNVFWDRFNTGQDLEMKDRTSPTGFARTNPVAGEGSGDNVTIASFVKNGGIVLGCGLAFRKIVDQYTKEDKLSPKDAEAKAREHILPGVVLQPSGFFAVIKAQEEGCRYMLGS